MRVSVPMHSIVHEMTVLDMEECKRLMEDRMNYLKMIRGEFPPHTGETVVEYCRRLTAFTNHSLMDCREAFRLKL
jgi:hypothetical protein